MEQIPPRLKLVILAVCLAIPTVLVAVFAGDTIFFWLVLAVVGAVATPVAKRIGSQMAAGQTSPYASQRGGWNAQPQHYQGMPQQSGWGPPAQPGGPYQAATPGNQPYPTPYSAPPAPGMPPPVPGQGPAPAWGGTVPQQQMPQPGQQMPQQGHGGSHPGYAAPGYAPPAPYGQVPPQQSPHDQAPAMPPAAPQPGQQHPGMPPADGGPARPYGR